MQLSLPRVGSVVFAAALALPLALPSNSADSSGGGATGELRSAVVSVRGPVGALTGVDVLAEFPRLSAALVRGSSAALGALAADPAVRAVAEDRVLRPTGGWPVPASGALAPQGVGGSAGYPGAGAGTSVAVVDTGLSDTVALSRLSGRVIDGVDTSALAEGGPVRTTGVFRDGYGHGTFMASLIAGGPTYGSFGRPVGIAPSARVVVVKVADDAGLTSLSEVLAGFDWIIGNADRVDVANFSFSGQRPGSGYGPDPLTDAVERVREAGVSVVVSAGNRPGVVGDPGFDPRVITVGAADIDTATVASFSGSAVVAGVAKPDLVASGVGVLGSLPPRSTLARQYPQAQQAGGLWRGSGSSQATAITSGVAALLLADHPTASPAQVKASLRTAARPVDDARAGAGLLRAVTRLSDGQGDPDAGSGGGTGEGGFDAHSWAANSWAANSWAANSWAANSWAANSWAANSWASVTRAGGSAD